MIPNKFIPPKDDGRDYNPEIDRMIEDKLEQGISDDDLFHQSLFDMPDDANDLKDVL